MLTEQSIYLAFFTVIIYANVGESYFGSQESRWLAEADPLASEHLVAQSEALLERTAGRKSQFPIA